VIWSTKFAIDPFLPTPTVSFGVNKAGTTSAATLVFLHGESSPVGQTDFLLSII
jgi:hypothetical protein